MLDEFGDGMLEVAPSDYSIPFKSGSGVEGHADNQNTRKRKVDPDENPGTVRKDETDDVVDECASRYQARPARTLSGGMMSKWWCLSCLKWFKTKSEWSKHGPCPLAYFQED